MERETQAPIVLGRGGAAIKKLGSAARQQIEEFLGRKVYLELSVQVRCRARVGQGRVLQRSADGCWPAGIVCWATRGGMCVSCCPTRKLSCCMGVLLSCCLLQVAPAWRQQADKLKDFGYYDALYVS